MAKRWFYTFKTFQGHTCEVDICDETFNGTPIELNKDVPGSPGCPSDNPVVIEEEDSDNLLDNVRLKTGYLNLIELTTDGLKDMFPLTNNSLEVLIFVDKPANISYDSDDADDYLIFHGYIQAQSFRQNYIGYHRSIKLPIQSMIAVYGDTPVDTTNSISGVLEGMSNIFKYVVFPYLTISHDGESTKSAINYYIYSSVIYPYNPNYNYGIADIFNEIPPVYSVITINQFLKMVCDGLGLICHEVANMLVFTKIGFTGDYLKYLTDAMTPLGVIGNGGSVNSLNLFSFASDKNSQSYILPTKSLKYEWDKFENPIIIDFSFCTFKSIGSGFTLLQYKGHDIVSNRWTDSNGYNFTGLRLIGPNDQNGEVLQLNDYSQNLFHCVFNTESTRVAIGFNKLHIEADSQYYYPLSISLQNARGKWYNFNPSEETSEETWVNSPVYKELSFNNNGVCEEDVQIVDDLWVTVFFHNRGSYIVQYNFKKIQLGNTVKVNRYREKTANEATEVTNEYGFSEKNIDYNLIMHGEGGIDQDNGYEALSISQRNLKLYLRKVAAINELNLLIGKFAIDANDQNNRVISSVYDIRNDIYELQVMGNQYF